MAAPHPPPAALRPAENGRERPLRVGVVADWEHCSRGVFWEELLQGIAEPATEVTMYRLPDRVAGAAVGEGDAGLFVESCDVLIVNWDAANGDPDFGASFTQRWFDARRPEVLRWVSSDGGFLVIEGQSVAHGPAQAAYDALLGRYEVRVSEPADDVDFSSEPSERMGGECELTPGARNSEAFRGLRTLASRDETPHDVMFPCRVLSRDLAIEWRYLYRGWFARQPLRRTKFRWVPVVRTVGRRPNHPTMLVARVGKGAIFSTTMFLANTRQTELVQKILRARARNLALPSPSPYVRVVQDQATRILVPAAVAALVGGAIGNVFAAGVVQGALVALLAAFVALLFRRPRFVRWLQRRALGR